MQVSPELILGIIGSVTGILGLIGLVVQVLKYLKEKPKIDAEIVEATHYYNPHGKEKNNYYLGFSMTIRVRNSEDRATTIGDALLTFKIGKLNFLLTEDRVLLSNGSKARIESNDLAKIRLNLGYLSAYDKRLEQKEIPIHLILHHAHGNIMLKGSSSLE